MHLNHIIRKKRFFGKMQFKNSLLISLNFAMLITLFFIYGCGTVPFFSHYPGPLRLPKERASYYDYPKAWTVVSIKEHPKGFLRIELRISGQEDEEDQVITMDYYMSSHGENVPGLLLSPILGGRNRIATHFARFFSKHGYHCLVVHRPPDLTDRVSDPQIFEERLRNAIIRDRVALDWLQGRPEVQADTLGSFGISYGGIKNVVLAAVDERLKANVFAMGGADLAAIFMNSDENKLIRIRKELMEENDWNPAQLESVLNETFVSDPLRYAYYVDASKTLLFLARMDATVPRENGERLRRALGYPKTVYLLAGHYSAALYTGIVGFPFVECQCLAFFDKHLK